MKAKWRIGLIAASLGAVVLLGFSLRPQPDSASPQMSAAPGAKPAVSEHLDTPALKSLSRAGAFREHSILPPADLIKVGLRHYQAGRIDLALDVLVKGSQRYPDNALLHSVLSSLYMHEKNWSAALQQVEEALRINPESVQDLTNRAQIYTRFARHTDALHDLDAAIAKNPTYLAAYYNRGSLEFNLKEYARALADFNKCIELAPRESMPIFNKAMTLWALQRTAEARATLQEFIDVTDKPQWKEQALRYLAKWQQDV